MVIACLLGLMINGEFEDHLVTGNVIKAQPGYYIVDFQNSVSGLHASGNYSRFIVDDKRCSVVQYKK